MRFHRFGKYEFRGAAPKHAAFARKQKIDPSYFLSMLHMYDTVRRSLDMPKA